MKLLTTLVVLLIFVLPVFNFLDKWDDYLSFSLYSDKVKLHYIAIEKSQLDKMDDRLNKYFVNIKGLSGGQIIDVNKWSNGELNVPFYPESRVFKLVSRSFCNLGIDNEKLIFLEFEQPLKIRQFHRYTCADLN